MTVLATLNMSFAFETKILSDYWTDVLFLTGEDMSGPHTPARREDIFMVLILYRSRLTSIKRRAQKKTSIPSQRCAAGPNTSSLPHYHFLEV